MNEFWARSTRFDSWGSLAQCTCCTSRTWHPRPLAASQLHTPQPPAGAQVSRRRRCSAAETDGPLASPLGRSARLPQGPHRLQPQYTVFRPGAPTSVLAAFPVCFLYLLSERPWTGPQESCVRAGEWATRERMVFAPFASRPGCLGLHPWVWQEVPRTGRSSAPGHEVSGHPDAGPGPWSWGRAILVVGASGGATPFSFLQSVLTIPAHPFLIPLVCPLDARLLTGH